MEIIDAYKLTVAAIGGMTLLMFVQLLVADFVGIKQKHVPGSAITADHNNLLFRASRTVANTNESVSIFILALAFSVLSSASPETTAYAAWAYVLTRALYALCYYSNLQILRSTCFGLSLIAIVTLFGFGVAAWFY